MNAENIIKTKVDDLPPLATHEECEQVSLSGRVDINILLNRARKIKEKETQTNLIFAGLTLSLIFIFGIILSL
jgi:hypothetical protein